MAATGGATSSTLLSVCAERSSWCPQGIVRLPNSGHVTRLPECSRRIRALSIRAGGRAYQDGPDKAYPFTRVPIGPDFSAARSAADEQLLADALSATRRSKKLSRDAEEALRRSLGTAKSSLKDSIDATVEAVNPGEPSIWKKVFAEFVGVFTLITVGCGSVAVNTLVGGSLPFAAVAATWGATVMAMAYAVGHISGGHFNPAVTIALGLFNKFPKENIAPYIAAQCAAATLATKVLEVILGTVAHVAVTIPKRAVEQCFAMEMIATAILMFVVAGVSTDSRGEKTMSGVAVGGVIFFTALLAGPISGGSLNPARTLGPALIANQYTGLWVYLAGPILGALLGMFAYEAIR